MGKKGSFLSILKLNLLPLCLGVLGLIFFVYGLISLLAQSKDSSGLTIDSEVEAKAEISIVSDIEGAVVKPGVYTLKDGSRLQDLLILSGGLSEEADREWVSKNLNLAQKLTDEAKIYIPKIGEAERSVEGTTQTGTISINSASSSQLESLPGIGVVTAGKIIDARPYTSLEDLLTKKVITRSVYEKIKDKVSVF